MSEWFRLNCICPSCGLGTACNWYHKQTSCCSDDGWLYINSSCNIKCDECYNRDLESPSFVLGWRFECENHKGEYRKADELAVCNAISYICTNNNIPKEVRRKMINVVNNCNI